MTAFGPKRRKSMFARMSAIGGTSGTVASGPNPALMTLSGSRLSFPVAECGMCCSVGEHVGRLTPPLLICAVTNFVSQGCSQHDFLFNYLDIRNGIIPPARRFAEPFLNG